MLLVLQKSQVTVGYKKAPSTLVDDCIDKFRQHEIERKRVRLLNGQRGSTESPPVEFLMGGEGDPLSSALNETMEDPRGPGGEDVTSGRDKRFKQIYDEEKFYWNDVCVHSNNQ